MLAVRHRGHHDERGIIWPAELTPYDVHVVGLGLDRPDVASKAELLYNELRNAGLDVLYDDRGDVSPASSSTTPTCWACRYASP